MAAQNAESERLEEYERADWNSDRLAEECARLRSERAFLRSIVLGLMSDERERSLETARHYFGQIDGSGAEK